MDFLENYDLTPSILEAFVEAGKSSAVRILQRAASKNANGILTERNLVEEFTRCFDQSFMRAIRNKPNKLVPPQRGTRIRHRMDAKEKRDRLQIAVRGAAALCHIANEIRHLPYSRKKAATSLLRNQKKTFYHQYSYRTLHPGVIKWIDVVLNDALPPGERAIRRPDLMIALHSMFARQPYPSVVAEAKAPRYVPSAEAPTAHLRAG